MNAVKEQNTYRIRATFTDDEGTAVTPSSGSYRVDDITGDTPVKVIDNTDFTPTTSYYDIVIPAASNEILEDSREEEERLVTVKFIYGDEDRQGAGEYQYTLQRLRRVATLLA